MNQQIQKLIDQFTVVTYDDVTMERREEFDKEKFAIQIIKECANIYSAIDNGNEVQGTEDYLEALYKTFRS